MTDVPRHKFLIRNNQSGETVVFATAHAAAIWLLGRNVIVHNAYVEVALPNNNVTDIESALERAK